MALSVNDEVVLAAPLRLWGLLSRQTLKTDVYAGFCVALLTIAQGMAYALVAGLPPVCGLLSGIFAAAVAGAFSSSRHVVIGPTNGIAVLVGFGISEVLRSSYPGLEGAAREIAAVQVMLQLGLMVALLQLAAAALKLGRLTQFISHSVVMGYVCGIALAIIIKQLPYVLGVAAPQNQGPLFYYLLATLGSFSSAHLPTVLVALAAILLLLSLRAWSPRIPAPPIMLVVISFCVWVGGVPTSTVAEIGGAVAVSPHLVFPSLDWTLFDQLLPIAFAVCLLSILETTAVGRGLAATGGYRLSINQEVYALALGNLASCLFGGMPASASTARSKLNQFVGGKTQWATIIGAGCVALFVVVGSGAIAVVPMAALAGLMLVTAGRMFDRQQIMLCFRATSADRMALITTVLGCLFFSIDIAFYVGMTISITLYLRNASRPELSEYHLGDSHYKDPLRQKIATKAVRVVNVEGEMFFGAADLFQHALKAIAADDNAARVIVLRLKNARDFDATTCLALEHLHAYLQKRNCALIICGVKPADWRVFSRSGIIDIIGADNAFSQDMSKPSKSLQNALKRAWMLAAPLPGEGLREAPNARQGPLREVQVQGVAR